VSSLAFSQSSGDPSNVPLVDLQTLQLQGELPKPGDIRDVLICAGSNEVLWMDVTRNGPEDRGAHEARRKAGWYAAVAMSIFAVDSKAIIDAIAAAKALAPKSKVYEIARSCRPAPNSWKVPGIAA
jgi:hypothetical protein